MKITILADLYEGESHDQAVDHVAEALREGGHKVSRLLVPGDLKAGAAGGMVSCFACCCACLRAGNRSSSCPDRIVDMHVSTSCRYAQALYFRR